MDSPDKPVEFEVKRFFGAGEFVNLGQPPESFTKYGKDGSLEPVPSYRGGKLGSGHYYLSVWPFEDRFADDICSAISIVASASSRATEEVQSRRSFLLIITISESVTSWISP